MLSEIKPCVCHILWHRSILICLRIKSVDSEQVFNPMPIQWHSKVIKMPTKLLHSSEHGQNAHQIFQNKQWRHRRFLIKNENKKVQRKLKKLFYQQCVFSLNTNSIPVEAEVLLLSLVRVKSLGSSLFGSGSDYFVTIFPSFFISTFTSNSIGHLQRYGMSINFQSKANRAEMQHSIPATRMTLDLKWRAKNSVKQVHTKVNKMYNVLFHSSI